MVCQVQLQSWPCGPRWPQSFRDGGKVMWCRYQLDTVKQCRVCGLIFFAEHNPIFLHVVLLSQLLLVFKRLACNSSCLMLETIAYWFRPYSSGISTAAHVRSIHGLHPRVLKGTSSWPVRWGGRIQKLETWDGIHKDGGVKYGKVYWIYFTPIFTPISFGHFLIHCFQLNDLAVECSKRFIAIFGDLVTWKVCWWRGAVPVSNGDTGKCTLLGTHGRNMNMYV